MTPTPTRVTQIVGAIITMTTGMILGILIGSPLLGLGIGLALSALTVSLSALDDPDRAAPLAKVATTERA